MTIYHVNGELVPASEATVSVRDRGFMYGDAAFETLRVYGGTVFEWKAHAERLTRTCEALGFADAMPPVSDLHERVVQTVAVNDFADAYARLSVTRGVQPGTLAPDDAVDPGVVVLVRELPRGGVEGEPVWAGPATVSLGETRAIPDVCVPAHLKTHNYLDGILARLEGPETAGGAPDEVLCVTLDGHLTEGTVSNCFFVADGTVHTPTRDLPLLPGITREVVLELAVDAGIPVETGSYGPGRLLEADEVFLTNTTWEVRPVTDIDGTEIPYGPVTRELQALFDKRVEGLY